MDYKKLIIELILASLLIKLFERMGRKDFPKVLKYPLMVILGLVYLVAIAGLGYYAIAAVGESIPRRVFAGVSALICLVFILRMFKKMVTSS